MSNISLSSQHIGTAKDSVLILAERIKFLDELKIFLQDVKQHAAKLEETDAVVLDGYTGVQQALVNLCKKC
jgi:hypothetical protein